MATDSITTNASIASAPNSKDFSKKKRVNRSAKLKQCKLDARREQWLSQVAVKNNKGRCEEKTDVRQGLLTHKHNGSNGSERSLENLEMRRRGEEIDGSMIHHHESDTESSPLSPSNSPTVSLLGRSESGTNFTGSGSSSSSSSGSGGSCCGNITEDEADEEGGDDDGVLDDWETVADALAASDNHQNQHQDQNNCPESPPKCESIAQLDTPCELSNRNSEPECPRMIPRTVVNSRAWRPDDEFRPQSLPNLSKQRSFPAANWHFHQAGVPWARNSAITAPTSCPICCEDLDPTDSSFLPCLCGFHLCLFCYKRILDEDGRCPGCRKPYQHATLKAEGSVTGGSMTFRLARSCSMIARS